MRAALRPKNRLIDMEFRNLTPQQQWIVELHRDGHYHCSTEYPMIDFRKRISELNDGYMFERGYEIAGIPCTMHGHKGNVHMRRAQKIVKSTHETVSPAPQTTQGLSQEEIEWWESLGTQAHQASQA